MAIFFGLELTDRSNPFLLISKTTVDKFPRHNFSNTDFGFYIGLQHANYSYFTNPRVFTANAKEIKIIQKIINETIHT